MNNHRDLKKPFYVAKNEKNTDFRYGKITEGQVFSSGMPIKTFSEKEDMILFVIDSGGTYIDDEIGEEEYSLDS